MQQLTQIQRKLIDEINKDPKLSNLQYSQKLEVSVPTIKRILKEFRIKGIILPDNRESGDHRKIITLNEEHRALLAECETVGIPLDSVSHYWYKGEHFSIFSKNKSEVNWETIRESLVNDMQKYSPKYPTIKRSPIKDPLLFVVDPSDPHFGKYSSKEETNEAYDLNIASKRYQDGIDGLINKVAHNKIEKILFISGNDRNHIDAPNNTTTAGTRQDTDGMWFEHFQAAKKAEIKALETLLTIADVHYVHCPSNHDFFSGFLFADSIASWFRNNKNISFDISPSHRKYVHYGYNLIGMTHGDGAKEVDLPDLMKTEARQAWAKSKYGYWYCHHIHHKDKKARLGHSKIQLEKDKIGVSTINTNLEVNTEEHCQVEYLRSISGTDSWHHRNGYQHSFKAMEGFLHHPKDGQVMRLNHLF